MPAPVDGFANGGNRACHSRRRFVVNHGDSPDAMRSIFSQDRFNISRVDAMAPIAGYQLHLQAEPDCHLAPQRRELASFEHQHMVARRKSVHQGGFPRAGSGGRKDHDILRSFEDKFQLVENFEGQPGELWTTMVDGGLGHGPQYALRDIGRSRNLEEMRADGSLHVNNIAQAEHWCNLVQMTVNSDFGVQGVVGSIMTEVDPVANKAGSAVRRAWK